MGSCDLWLLFFGACNVQTPVVRYLTLLLGGDMGLFLSYVLGTEV